MPKKVKDFSPEERKLILKDVEEIGLQAAADKNDTTWQAIRSIQRIAEGRTVAKPTTQEERDRIWQRVNEVGFAQAAAENDMNERTIRSWQERFGMPKPNIVVTPVISATTATSATETAENKKDIMRREFSLEKKAEIVAQSRKLGVSETARIYSIRREMIYKWRKTIERLQTQAPIKQPQELNNDITQINQINHTEAETPLTTSTPLLQEVVQPQKTETPAEMPQIHEDAVRHEESVNNEAGNNEASADTQPVAAIDIADDNDNVDNTVDNKAIEVLFSADVKALAARVRELSIEVAILKEKNADLTHKIATLEEVIKILS